MGATSVDERSGAAMPEITDLLTRLNGGDKSALDSLIPLVYQELHRIAWGYLQREDKQFRRLATKQRTWVCINDWILMRFLANFN